MAHSLSAKKRVRQHIKARARNRWRLRTLRAALKDYDEKLLHASLDDAKKAYISCCSLLDKTASNGVIHKNTASRRKSRLNNRLRAKAAK